MENISWTIVCGILIVLIWKGVFSVFKYVRMCRKLRKVPQQPSHWLLGHLNRIKGSKDYVQYGMEMYKTGCKLFCIWLGPNPVVCVNHPDTFKQLIGQEHRKARGRLDGYHYLQDWMGEGLLISDGWKWERIRKLLTPAFHFSILTGYVDIMNSASDDFQEKVIENMSASPLVDIYPLVSRMTLDTMMKCSLSFDGSMQAKMNEEYVKAVQRMGTLLVNRCLTPYIPQWLYYLSAEGREWKKLINVVQGFTRKIIDARQMSLESRFTIFKYEIQPSGLKQMLLNY
ncbi:cytochrome P450 4F6-like [Mya arenaria]|uniref:cytochrome P450 4F6-like n=1 Tax=Mya arenaria TaxID=6604 RepID=UPI0022E939E1|nr:cytochrome P450 4F6-like [Mya arenaria]